jgi:hypothetical protein
VAIHVPTVPDLDDGHRPALVVDGIDHPIVALADPEPILAARQLLAA